jgi:hypothetical protein
MVNRFDPKGRCGQILKEIERLFPSVNLWLEWSPPRIVARHNGFFLRKIKGNGWKLALNMKGEPRHVVRVRDVDEAGIARIKALVETLIVMKPKTPKPAVQEPERKEEPMVTKPVTNAEPTKHPLPANSDSAELVLEAIGDIVRGEKLLPVDGWYTVEKLGEKILAEFAHTDKEKLQVRATLPRLINKLVSTGKIKYEKKPKYRDARIAILAPKASTVAAGEATPLEEEPPTTLPVAPPVAISQATAQALGVLKAASWQEVLQLKEAIKSDATLSSLLQYLLQK